MRLRRAVKGAQLGGKAMGEDCSDRAMGTIAEQEAPGTGEMDMTDAHRPARIQEIARSVYPFGWKVDGGGRPRPQVANRVGLMAHPERFARRGTCARFHSRRVMG